MEDHQGILLVLIIGSLAIIDIVQCQQDQQGFISLDCGLPTKESPYIEPTTKLNFSSDAEFIGSGETGTVADDWINTYQKQNNILRYFPEGLRNCYNLIVKQGTNYIIRATFSYGNYDGLDKYPKFDMYIGPNLWTTVDLGNGADREIIHMPKSNSLQICLVKTGPTTPMITTLELRPLRNDTYTTQTGTLKLLDRHYYVTENDIFGIRFPDDVYDRKWNLALPSNDEIQINTTANVNQSRPFELPQAVMKRAITPKKATEPLTLLFLSDDNPSDKFYVYFHFAEIQALRANDRREFDIVWEDTTFLPPYSPKRFQSDTIFNKLPKEQGTVKLVKTKGSTLPPLINAIEAFKVMDLPYSETNPDDVVSMKNIEAAYALNFISWQGDPCLPRQYKWEYIECSYTNISTPPRIISLDLSGQGLKGTIVPVIQNLTQLQKLDLSNNTLSGEVPEFLANMKSLSSINLSWNNLTGKVPQALRDREKNGLIKLSFLENQQLCQDDKCKDENKNKLLVPVVASVVSFVIIVAVMAIIFVSKKKRKLKVNRRTPINKLVILSKKNKFTYSEVEAMTNNFERAIGEGGFGTVYHGSLNDIEQVAVKVLSHSSTQGYKEFKAEVELLLRVHHTNLVNLVGYCNEEDQLALVYEYAANGDLKQHLSGEFGGATLNWLSRLRIATGAAQGLEYLHAGCEPAMVHRDVKTTNILLDGNFQAKLADFGLSRSFPNGADSHVSTNVAGTPGYLDPEYYQTNWLTEKSDVYSLGIVLLEMITNCPVIQQAREKPHIAEWVGYMLTKGDIESIMDSTLSGDYDSSSVWKALELAMSCVNPSSVVRPSMSQVVSELKECLMYENSRNGEIPDKDSKSFPELSTNFTTEVTPDAR